jgi:hypothetical protein
VPWRLARLLCHSCRGISRPDAGDVGFMGACLISGVCGSAAVTKDAKRAATRSKQRENIVSLLTNGCQLQDSLLPLRSLAL